MQINSSYGKSIDTYYENLANYANLNVTHEQGIRSAFRGLLDTLGKQVGWTLIEEHTLPGSRKRPDGTLMDSFQIPRGYWEAKDTKDDLEAEIIKKSKLGYDLGNTIFEDSRKAVLFQNRQRVLEVDLSKRDALNELLTRYFTHTPAEIEEFHKAESEFRTQIPVLAKGLIKVIEEARAKNKRFINAFAEFHELCRTALNPAVRAEEIEEMLVQHLLTERLFRNVFDNPEFTKRNVIAAEIEKVITALTSQSFSRESFLKQLDYFYIAIENTAKTITDFSEKQGFLNTIYERFFQGFSTKTADTHGIVYTPQAIVDFMCASVEEVLKSEFDKSLSDEGVTILDPCTGTGNFLVNILRRISPLDLGRKYSEELFANELMLLPYYIAALNIEHAYFDIQKQYEIFPGLCFVDTLDLNTKQLTLGFTQENTERVQREQDTSLTVIIGNPPYNVGQKNENDNNKNRKYPELDLRIKQTYGIDSKATLTTKLYDPYVRFFRWATDRLNGKDGIVCFVTNNSFVDQFAFDGMRKHLLQDYTQVYHIDLHGNVRKNPKLSGTTHNVFGIQVGAGITIAVRKSGSEKFLKYHRVPEYWRKGEKLEWLAQKGAIDQIEWQTLQPDVKNTWLTDGMDVAFDNFMPLATKATKESANEDVEAIFKNYSLGVATNRDEWAYDFNSKNLVDKLNRFINNYNNEVKRWVSMRLPDNKVDAFVNTHTGYLKWTDRLKEALIKREHLVFDATKIKPSMYRPFCRQFLYFDHLLNQRRYQQHRFFPDASVQNEAICLSSMSKHLMFCLMTKDVPDLHFTGDAQCFPLYTYAVDGKIKRDNITNWALGQFQGQYEAKVTKLDIFHYVYGLLHSPEYRTRYAENLKRELPRIPLVASIDDFWAFADAGKTLSKAHIHYEKAKEYPLKAIVNKDVPFSWHVTKMKFNKDKTALIVNESLTLAGIPAEAFKYKLGNRSALDWVIDQYQVTTDKRSGIVSDPNRDDDQEYIVRLVRKIVTVSVETAKCVAALPSPIPDDANLT